MTKRVRSVVLALALSGGPVVALEAPVRSVLHPDPSVSVEVISQGAGPLVVLLPSRGRGAADFDVLAADLAAAGFRVIRPEPRGVGQSAGPTEGTTLHDLGRDVAAAIDAAQAGPAILVGHAFGNFIARTVAIDRPELVRGVALVAAAGKSYPDWLAAAVTKSSDLTLPDSDRLAALQATFFAPGHDASVWLGGWYPAVDHAERAATLRTPQADWWSAGHAPLLEIQAADDPFKTPAQRNELRDQFGARVSVTVIPDAGHALIPEQPKAVAEALVAWIRAL